MNVTRACVLLVIMVSVVFACTQQGRATVAADSGTVETVIRKITGWVKIDDAPYRRLDRFENDEVICYQATQVGDGVSLQCIWKDFD